MAGTAGGTSAFSFRLLPFLGCSGAKLVTLVTVSPELYKKRVVVKAKAGLLQGKGKEAIASVCFLNAYVR